MSSAFNNPDDIMIGINGVGTGWHQIVRDLEQQLDTISANYTVLQVKEKFGTLRYYAMPPEGTDRSTSIAFYEAIGLAEERSATTCEWCGVEGKTRTSRGWYVTLCDKHFAERETVRAMEEDLRE